MPTSLRPTANSFSFDDSIANLDPNAVQIAVQEAIENLDIRQDIDDATHFRPENVLSAIASVTATTPDGWHLNTATNELVRVLSGAIADSYTPKQNDTIIIEGIRKDFNGSEWLDLVFVNKVISGSSPSVSDWDYEIGTEWVSGDRTWKLLDRVAGVGSTGSQVVESAQWVELKELNSNRKLLSEETTYYVRKDGDDNSTEPTTESGAFATIGRALDAIDFELDLGGNLLIIDIGAGDYAAEGLLHLPVITGGKAETCAVAIVTIVTNPQIRLVGAGETTVLAGLELDHHAYYSVENLKITKSSTQKQGLIKVQRAGILELDNLYLDGSSSSGETEGIWATDNGIIYIARTVRFYNDFVSILKTESGARIEATRAGTAIIRTSQVANNTYFINATSNSFIDLETAAFNY